MRKLLSRISIWLDHASTPTQLLFWVLVGPGLFLALPALLVPTLHDPAFESGFWASYLATILGLIFGIPIALWINRAVTSASGAVARQEQRQLLRESLSTVLRTIEEDQDILAIYLAHLQDPEQYVIIGSLDTSAWDAVKHIVVQHLGNPLLQGQIASYFAIIEQISYTIRLHRDHSLSHLAGTNYNSKTRLAIRDDVLKAITFTIIQGADLITDIKKTLS